MTGDGVNVFASKEYHFLYWLSRLPCVTLEGQPVIRLSQIELADQYGSSPATVFAMLHTLQKAGCIQPYRRKSGYIVTGTGRAVIGRMEQIRPWWSGPGPHRYPDRLAVVLGEGVYNENAGSMGLRIKRGKRAYGGFLRKSIECAAVGAAVFCRGWDIPAQRGV